jgi:hypothetical protein
MSILWKVRFDVITKVKCLLNLSYTRIIIVYYLSVSSCSRKVWMLLKRSYENNEDGYVKCKENDLRP